MRTCVVASLFALFLGLAPASSQEQGPGVPWSLLPAEVEPPPSFFGPRLGTTPGGGVGGSQPEPFLLQKRFSATGMVIGAVVGAGVGYALSRAVFDDGCRNDRGWASLFCVFGKDTGTEMAVAVGAVVGAVLGSQVRVNRSDRVPLRVLPVVISPAYGGRRAYGIAASLPTSW